MDNQHRMIKGYRDLSESEISVMNGVKAEGEAIRKLIEELKIVPGVDQRWVNIGQTHLQQGIMALVRAVAQPTSF